jgi:hypothetical protein
MEEEMSESAPALPLKGTWNIAAMSNARTADQARTLVTTLS